MSSSLEDRAQAGYFRKCYWEDASNPHQLHGERFVSITHALGRCQQDQRERRDLVTTTSQHTRLVPGLCWIRYTQILEHLD